jgi:aldehyde:ferredoxin oxidoreductase
LAQNERPVSEGEKPEANRMKGIFGKYLDVDLSTGRITDYAIPSEWYLKYLGGRGIGLRLLLEELKGGEDPLGPENILVFATGPLQGIIFPGAGRHAVLSKSPMTGSLSDSYAGGFFGYELGRSGYDGLIIRGEASEPRVLSFMNGQANLHDANHLWGKDVGSTHEILKETHQGARIACIGPAGEKMVKFSSIMHDINRAAGRSGFGSVMGSKRLKAIVVKGGIEKPVFEAGLLMEARKKLAKDLMADTIRAFGRFGTTATVSFLKASFMEAPEFAERANIMMISLSAAGPA